MASTSYNAHSLLADAKQQCAASGELIKLVMSGTRRVDSWVIENRVIPFLRGSEARMLHFVLTPRKEERQSAWLIPLPDGEAFACHISGRWSALEKEEALSALRYIGFRYAPENRWVRGFEAFLQSGDEAPRPVEPFAVAAVWEEVTGTRPQGFAHGVLDEMEAIGFKLIGRIFNTQGRLGI